MRISILLGWLVSLPAAFGLELTTPPTVELSASTAVVHWHTDVASGTRAQVFPAGAKISVPDKTPGADHTVILSGLQPGANYSVVVGSARIWLATNSFTTTGTAAPAKIVGAVKSGGASVPASRTSQAQTARADTHPTNASEALSVEKLKVPPTRKIWANWPSLPDHFARHGGDFHAKDADDYARMSWEFLQRTKTDGLPAKIDDDGVFRVFDPKSGAFASYNRDGTTKTFFKPGGRDYFERQPGQTVNLKTLK